MTDFWSQNNPFSRHFVTLEWPKWLAMGSKRAHFTCLGTPNGVGSFLEKHIFDPFLSQNSPFSRHFGILGRPKRTTTSSNCSRNSCFGIPCGPRSFLKKVNFLHPVGLVDTFWHPPHIWAPVGPNFSHHKARVLAVGWTPCWGPENTGAAPPPPPIGYRDTPPPPNTPSSAPLPLP